MRNPHDNYWIPGEGYAYISNGTAWSDGIYLGSTDSIDNWHDTNDPPPEPQVEAEPEDYEAALERLGVEL